MATTADTRDLLLYVFVGGHLPAAKPPMGRHDASAGAKEESACIVAHLRKAWPERGRSGSGRTLASRAR